MKLLLCLLISLILTVHFPTVSHAAECASVQEYTEKFSDVICFTTRIITISRSRLADCSANICSGKKTSVYKSASGSKLWSVTVTGTFLYGSDRTVTCTSAEASAESFSTSWKVNGLLSSKDGNQASATATGTEYLSFKPVASITKTVILSCDTDGTLY